MLFESLIRNFSIFLSNLFHTTIDVNLAGSILSFIFVASVVLSVYILTVSNEIQHQTKTWMAVAYIVSTVFFSNILGWMTLLHEVIVLIIPLSLALAYYARKFVLGG